MTLNTQSIVAANFALSTSIKTTNGIDVASLDRTYDLMPGSYTVSVLRTGTSTTSIGYALIKIGDFVYHSAPLEKDTPITFTVTLDTAMKVEFLPIWGTPELDDQNKIADGSSIEIILEPPVEEPIDPIENEDTTRTELAPEAFEEEKGEKELDTPENISE